MVNHHAQWHPLTRPVPAFIHDRRPFFLSALPSRFLAREATGAYWPLSLILMLTMNVVDCGGKQTIPPTLTAVRRVLNWLAVNIF